MSAFSLLPKCAIPRLSSRGARIAHQSYRTFTVKSWNYGPIEEAESKRISPKTGIEVLLATPSWSVQTLLPSKDQTSEDPPISSEKLRHLLRLSALPPPASEDEEKKMLDTLASQLHFVREMQKVDTEGVEPLRAIRDETKAAEKRQEITLDTLKESLAKEEVVGEHYKRIRRKEDTMPESRQPHDWGPLKHAQRTAGKFFVVDSGKSTDG